MPTSRTGTKAATTKIDQVLQALRTRHGVALTDLMQTTGWQPHTVRAALSRLRQKGHTIERVTLKSGVSRYRLVKSPA